MSSPSSRPFSLRRATLRLAGVTALLFAAAAGATPSFARQTGFSCSQCHTQFPELTAFGRAFKAGGYTMILSKSIHEAHGDRKVLDLISLGPVSMMLQSSFTHTARPQSVGDGTPPAKNNDVELPQQLSFFYAGRIAPKVGAFVQLTYDGTEDHLGMDNADLRFAHTLPIGDKSLILGVTLNNNPTVQDLWNSTPAWGYPFAASEVAPSPAAAPLIAGALAQNVAGLGAYAFWNGLVYGEISVYGSAPLGVSRPLGAASDAADVIHGAAPYWRLAVEKDVAQHSIEVGTFGLAAQLYPGAADGLGLVGATDHYLDLGVDAQYQYVGDRHVFTADASVIHENQFLEATYGAGLSSRISHHLLSYAASGSYLWERTLGLRLGYFATEGTTDVALYAPAGLTGSRTGSPFSDGLIGELSYTPWLNTKFSLQYTAYLNFNGSGSNYDGAGREASANDTLYLLSWLSF